MSKLYYYIVIFDTVLQDRVEMRELSDGEVAEGAYRRLAEEFKDDERIHVVLFAADSVDTLRSTHPHYFRSPDSTASAPFTALAET